MPQDPAVCRVHPARNRAGRLIGVLLTRNGEPIAYALEDDAPGFIVFAAPGGQPLRHIYRLRHLRNFYPIEQQT